MNNSRVGAALWFLSNMVFFSAAAQREVQLGALILSTIVFALLMGLYLMFSAGRVAEILPQFTNPSTALPSLLEIVGWGVYIFLFVALPEEILFRGVIQRYLERVLRWSQRATLILSSVIFGASHLNNPPNDESDLHAIRKYVVEYPLKWELDRESPSRY